MGKRINLADLANDDIETSTQPEDVASIGASNTLPTDQLALNPLNKRYLDTDEELAWMIETINANGIVQPLVVCTSRAYLTEFPDQGDAIGQADWVTLIGNRRLQAARLVGLETVPVLLSDEHAASMYEVMLVENGQRRDLAPAHEAEAMQQALETQQLSRRELARRIGRTHTYINQRLALLGLVPELRKALEAGELTVELARQFGELSEHQQQEIASAGKPYRHGGNGVSTSTSRLRRIQVSTPAVAAKSIRSNFSHDELTELIRLLTTPEGQ